jgi:hypothetical protein
MPMKVAKSDRRLLMWAAAILVPIVIALAIVSQPDEDSGVPSTYSAKTKGAKAAFVLLQEAGYDAQRWERSPADLPIDSGSTVLVLAGPTDYPSREEKEALERFLDHGGTIVATGSFSSFFLPEAKIGGEAFVSPEWKDFQPSNLTSLTRGGTVQMSPDGYWESPSLKYLVHYADGDRPIVVSYKVGQGQVIWWGSSIPLSNAGIEKSGNLALLLNSVGDPREVHVFWDEYFHGYRRSIGSYFFDKPVLLGFAQGALVCLALLFTYSRRNGPIRPWHEPSRLSPLEFVETLGNLYRQANAVQAALDVPYARFRYLTTKQLGLKSDIPAADLARAIRNRLRYKDPGLEDTLHAIEATRHGPELSEAQTLELVQQLSRHAYNLKFISKHEQEIAPHADSVPGTRARPD